MGLDLGTKTIGVAVSDIALITAQPVGVIKRVSLDKDLFALKELIDSYEVSEIVIGLPVNMDGTMGARAEASVKFKDRLTEYSGLRVHLWDERLSTAAVNRVLIQGDISRQKRKGVVDKLAASYILQGYLDSLTSRAGGN